MADTDRATSCESVAPGLYRDRGGQIHAVTGTDRGIDRRAPWVVTCAGWGVHRSHALDLDQLEAWTRTGDLPAEVPLLVAVAPACLTPSEAVPSDPRAREADPPANDQGVKHDGGKPRWSLLPFDALTDVVAVLEFGARKYAPDNWRKVPDARRRYFDASLRHLTAWWSGERLDPETGLPHLAHAGCCVLFLLSLDREVSRG